MKKTSYKITILLLAFVLMISSVSVRAYPGETDVSYGTTGFYIDNVPNPQSQESTRFFDGEVTADGRMTVVGSFTYPIPEVNYFHDFYVQRILPDGARDTSFGNGTGSVRFANVFPPGSVSVARAVRIQQDNKIVIAGHCNIVVNFRTQNQRESTYGICAARLLPSGALDTSFGGNQVQVQHANDPNTWFNYTMPAGTTLVHYPGQIEVGWVGTTTNVYAGALDVAIHSDGRIVLAGYSATREFNSQGGFLGYNHYATLVTLTPNGALSSAERIAGDQNHEQARRAHGRSFHSVETQSDGSVVAVGENPFVTTDGFFTANRWLVYNGNINGVVVWHSENLPTGARATSVKFTRSNKILVSGTDDAYPQVAGSIRRFHGNNLVLDASFGNNGKITYCHVPGNCDDKYVLHRNSGALKLDSIQPDGKILAVVGGEMNPIRFKFDPLDGYAVTRFNPDGSVDRSFGFPYGETPNWLYNYGYARLHRETAQGIVQAIGNAGFAKLQPDGKILSGGGFYVPGQGSPNRGGVTRRQNTFRSASGGILSDFNNDGRSDFAVFRQGNWYYLDSFTNQFRAVNFGLASDKLAPADYDGDGRTDVAVFRDGNWYISQSSNNQFRAVNWGTAGDLPRPGDFNGDGFADIAVFRPSNGTWYINYSNPIQPGNIQFNFVQFGQSGDAPLIADFDADGKSDIAVFRQSNGTWYYLQSTNNQFRAIQFGQNGDTPVAGDYDADSKSDIAVFRASNGTWYRLNSSNNQFVAIQFGANGDRAVPGDYDNDGRNDLAVYRAGNWFVLRSSDNQFRATSFGIASDIPIQAAFLP